MQSSWATYPRWFLSVRVGYCLAGRHYLINPPLFKTIVFVERTEFEGMEVRLLEVVKKKKKKKRVRGWLPKVGCLLSIVCMR